MFCFVSGCSTVRSKYQYIQVSTNIPADIYLNGQYKTTGKQFIGQVRRNKELLIQTIPKDKEYEQQKRLVRYHLSTTGVLDIIGGIIFIIPFAGLYTAGAFSLDDSKIYIALLKKTARDIKKDNKPNTSLGITEQGKEVKNNTEDDKSSKVLGITEKRKIEFEDVRDNSKAEHRILYRQHNQAK